MADLVPMSQAATTSLVTTLQNTDLFALAREDITSETGFRSKVSRVDVMAKKVAKETDYSDLQTTSKTIIGAINEVKSSAKENLSDLTDTTITTPSNADLLAYDSSTSKWVNTDLKGTASGSIATFSNGGNGIPVSEFECEIVATGGGGTPDSPIAINGFSQADISVMGENLWNDGDLTITTNQSLDVNIPAGTYNLSGEWVTNSGYDCLVIFYDENNTELVRSTFTRDIRDNKSYQFLTPCKRIAFYSGDNYIHSNGKTATISNIMLKKGSSVADYEPYTGNLYTVVFGQTIYGGRLIYANGQWSLEATHGFWITDGTEIWNDGGSGDYYTTSHYLNDSLTGSSNGLSNYFTYNWSFSQTNGCMAYTNRIQLTKTSFASIADMQTAFSQTPLIIVYPLATPVIIPITSSTRVKTISGDNNIYSNTGDCELKYFTDKADNIAELIKAFL